MTLPLHAVYWLVHVPHARPVAWQARHVLSKRGLRPEAFISPGDSSEETVVFICAASRLHVRSAAALPPVPEAAMAAPGCLAPAWEATRQDVV